jgi:endonuclease/exonuclease/phosphatase family metal-dependent hydrolase
MKYKAMKQFFYLVFLTLCTMPLMAEQQLKIMVWNIFMVPPVIFKSCQPERALLIADYIKLMDADIVVLEESFMKSTREVINEKLNSIYPYQSSITKSGLLKTNSGVWILSKYPITKQDFIRYKKKKGSDIFARKGATFTEILVDGKKVQIIGSHTQSLPKYKSTRALQFQQLKTTMLDKYFTDSIPQLVVGDLNCNYYDTSEYNSMLQLLDVLPVNFSGEKYSWNGLENDLAHTFSERTLETLDYVLLRNRHESLAEIISTEITKPYSDYCICNKNFHYLSDHHPVVAVVRLK